MKRIVAILVLAGLVLASCDFAAQHDLPPEPAKDLAMELLDQSEMVTYGRAVIFASFTTTDPEWGNYLFIDVDLKAPDGTIDVAEVDVAELEDGNLRGTIQSSSNLIEQGTYTMTVYAGETRVETEYDYDMEVAIPGTNGQYLSARIDSYNSPRAPYIAGDLSEYTIAISDDETEIFIRPEDSHSAGLTTLFYFVKDNYLNYVYVISPDEMAAGSWSRIPVANLIQINSTPDALTASDFRANWEVDHYATVAMSTDWGTLNRSEYRSSTISVENPTTGFFGSVASPSARTLEEDPLMVLSPLAIKTLEAYQTR